MFNSATKDNRVVTTALTVTYETERHYETLADGTLQYWWMVTRKASKDYRFINMTEKAVILAAAAKVEMYTRQTRKCISRTLDKVCPSLTTSVQPEFNDCGSWDLVINVSETDSTHSATLPADPAALFTDENARDYDEGESGIEVDYADGAMTIANITGIAESVIRSSLTIRYTHEDDTSTWYTANPDEVNIASITPIGDNVLRVNVNFRTTTTVVVGGMLKWVISGVESNIVVIQPPI